MNPYRKGQIQLVLVIRYSDGALRTTRRACIYQSEGPTAVLEAEERFQELLAKLGFDESKRINNKDFYKL